MKLEGLERSKGLIVQLPVCVHISGKTDQGLHEFDNLLGFYSFVLQFVSGKLIIFKISGIVYALPLHIQILK